MRRARMARALHLIVLVLACGCVGAAASFPCDGPSQCVRDGVPGTCEATGFCSFADPSCASGRRYAAHASAALAGTCTDGVDALEAPRADAAPRPCEGGTAVFRTAAGRCFSRHDVSMTTVEAMVECARFGRMLAIFDSEAEELEVLAGLVPEPGVPGGYHIGVLDVFGEGEYRWLDHRPITYSRWLPGEPQGDAAALGDDAVVLESLGGPRGWADVDFEWLAGALCGEPVRATAPDGERYQLVYGFMGSLESALACAEAGAVLATITTADENAFVAARMTPFPGWFGANDRVVEGSYGWTSGARFGPYTAWGAGEPSDDLGTTPGTEDCAVIDSLGLWHDVPCGRGFTGAAVCDEGR